MDAPEEEEESTSPAAAAAEEAEAEAEETNSTWALATWAKYAEAVLAVVAADRRTGSSADLPRIIFDLL